MNIQEMHLAVRMGVDKINSMYLDNLLPEEIDLMLNRAQSAFIKQRLNPLGTRYGKGYDQNQKRIDDVRTLVTESTHYPAYDYNNGNNIMTDQQGPWTNDIDGNDSTLAELGCLFFAGIASGGDITMDTIANALEAGGQAWLNSWAENLVSQAELNKAKRNAIYADALFLPAGHNFQPLDYLAENPSAHTFGWPMGHYYEHLLSVTVSTVNYQGQPMYPGFHWGLAHGTVIDDEDSLWPDVYRARIGNFFDDFNLPSTTDPDNEFDLDSALGFEGSITPYSDDIIIPMSTESGPTGIFNPVQGASYHKIEAASYVSHDDLQKALTDPFNGVGKGGPKYTLMNSFNFLGSLHGRTATMQDPSASYFGQGRGTSNAGGFYTDSSDRTLEGPRHDCLVVFSDNKFFYNWVKITYIRRAAQMVYGQARSPQLENVSCELPIHTHWEIVNMTVDYLLEGFTDPRYKTHSVETAKSE